MCTVTFVPIRQGYLLCSNRDERISRAQTLPPARYDEVGMHLFYPRDMESTGTWIAASSGGLTFCLLNGAFEAHIPAPPYRKSRGLILLEILKAGSADKFLINQSLEGIEPFTLVMISENSAVLQLQELRWDGRKVWLQDIDSGIPAIWSSSTLYPPETRRQRELWFREWLQQHPEPTREDLFQFHSYGGSDDQENNLIMKRPNDRQTISITAVQLKDGKKSMLFHNLISATDHELEIV